MFVKLNSGEIRLRPEARNLLGAELLEGNVYLDEKPVHTVLKPNSTQTFGD